MAITVRDLDRTPPPHDFEHCEKALKSLTAQSTGHGCVLHVRFSTKAKHGLPPCAGWEMTDRDFDCTPPPHDFEHCVKSLNLLTAQSTGHVWLLQGRSSIKGPHCFPSSVGCVMTLRDLVCMPSPHETEHVVKAVKSLNSQLTALSITPTDVALTLQISVPLVKLKLTPVVLFAHSVDAAATACSARPLRRRRLAGACACDPLG